MLLEDWVKQGKCRAIFKWVGEGEKRRKFLIGFERTSKRSRDYKTKYFCEVPIDWEAHKKAVLRKMAEKEAEDAAQSNPSA